MYRKNFCIVSITYIEKLYSSMRPCPTVDTHYMFSEEGETLRKDIKKPPIITRLSQASRFIVRIPKRPVVRELIRTKSVFKVSLKA